MEYYCIAVSIYCLVKAIHSQERRIEKFCLSQMAGSPKSYGVHDCAPCANHVYCDALKSNQFYLVIIIINSQTQPS